MTLFKVKVVSSIVASAILSVLAASEVSAQAAPPAAGCFVSPARLSDADISSFLASPDGLLTQFSSGGLPLSNQVRALAGSSADTLSPLVALASRANAGQAAAIGAGLARAARACAVVNPQYAAQIQDAVAGTGNQAFETAFLAGGNETQTAALGGPAAGGSAVTGAGAIGGGGTPGGGANGAAGGTSSVGSGVASFSAGGGSTYFADDDGGSTSVDSISPPR